MAAPDSSSVSPGRVRLLVCDLDGTLIDSIPMVMAAFRHAVAPWATWPDDGELRRILSGNYLACLRSLLPTEAPLEPAVERLVAYSRAHEDDVIRFDGAEEFLSQAATRVRIVLWTNRDRRSMGRHCARLGLEPYVHAAVCGDDAPTHKPETEGMLKLLGELGVAPAEALFVGDSDVDVEGGHRCGMPTVLIRHGQTFPAELEAKACQVVETQQQAYAWILARLGKDA